MPFNFKNYIPVITSIFFITLAYFFINPAEDSVILYEYSKTLATEGLISYGNNAIPIEGATDFLWMLFISLFSFFGIDEFLSALILTSMSLFILVKLLSNKNETIVLPLIAIVLTPYIYSAALGFSAVFFATIYVICLHYWTHKEYRFMYLALLVLCLTRPDGVIWGAPLVLLHQLIGGITKSKIILSLKHLILPGIMYFIWRYDYFGHLLPLPFYVKSSGERDLIIFFYSSIKAVAIVLIPALVIFYSLQRKKEIFFILLIPIIFYSTMQLTQNVGNRFMAPMFFGSYYLIKSASLRKKAIFTILSILLSIIPTKRAITGIMTSKHENIFPLAKALNTIDGTMLITEAGRLPYYSDWYAHDSWGLNTPKFSKQLLQPADIENSSYDLIVAHCQIDLLHQTLKAKTARSWENQCNNMIIGMQGRYDYYLVPFVRYDAAAMVKDSSCIRHDIYAVRKNADNAVDIKAVLLRFQAIAYTKSLPVNGDQLCITGLQNSDGHRLLNWHHNFFHSV